MDIKHTINKEREIFDTCLGLFGEDRANYINTACSGDEALEKRIHRLLAAHESATLNDAAKATNFTKKPTVIDGETVGPYRLLECIGEGGMGAVYIAEKNHPFRRWVALKIVKLGMDTKEVIARFEAERQALALMNHPNIARILDAGMISTGRPYFVMEYVPGIPITKYCDEKRLGIGKRLELFVEVCRAVQHAHQKGVIHRDLKPSNILVMEQDGQPVPKIIDFGIAKATHLRLSNHSLHTQAGNLMGTPEYMSPEQISSSLDIDTRTDVYSLGVILCELLTGKLPFPECSGPGRHTDLSKIRLTKKDNEHLLPSTILRRALDDEHIALLRSASVHSLTRQLRGDLDWIAAKALENDRGRRYAMPLALAGDICNYLHNEPISAGPPSAIYRLKKFAHRNRLVVSVLTSIFGLVIALNVMIGVQAERLAIERDRANTEARAAAETSDFLLDVFNTDNPSTTGKSKSAVKRLLDKRVVRINRELAQQPLARMRVLYTLGRAYQYMGFTEEALKLYEEIYQFYEAELGSKHPDTLNVAVNIGSSHQLLTNLDEAEKFLSFAHENSSRYLGEMHPIAQRAICTLSVVYINRGENEKAIQTLTPILNVAPGNTSVQQQRYASCARILGVAHQAQGSYDKAHAAFTKSLEVQTRQLGANHADTLRTKYELGTNYGYRQDYHQAALVLEEVLPEQQHVLGEDHYQTLDTKSFLAQTYIYFERNEEAEKLLKDVYEKIRSQRGDDHPDTYTALGLVCVTYVNRMLALKADDCFKNTILGLQNTLGSDSPITLGMLNHWADALTKFGRYSEAEAVLKGTFNTMLTQRDANSHDVLMVRYNIICLHALQGRKNQAIKLFEELVADGFRSEFALTDSKLDSLRGEPEFDNIIAKIKRHTSNTDS